jgi:hypothetical protein
LFYRSWFSGDACCSWGPLKHFHSHRSLLLLGEA